jgi:hypothetical protein
VPEKYQGGAAELDASNTARKRFSEALTLDDDAVDGGEMRQASAVEWKGNQSTMVSWGM